RSVLVLCAPHGGRFRDAFEFGDFHVADAVAAAVPARNHLKVMVNRVAASVRSPDTGQVRGHRVDTCPYTRCGRSPTCHQPPIIDHAPSDYRPADYGRRTADHGRGTQTCLGNGADTER